MVIGFLKLSLMSSSTFAVAVAVSAIIGMLGNLISNFLRLLKALLESFHSVNRCASSMAIRLSDSSLASIRECNIDQLA